MSSENNRIAFYVFFDRNGVARGYVLRYLKSLKEVAGTVAVIVNGKLTAESRSAMESLGCVVLVRENRGLDFGAWKYAFGYYGMDNVRRYDELILCNCSCYGPVSSFSEVFDAMENRECDFWGITRHQCTDAEMVVGDPESKIVEHVQSYFMVFRKSVLSSKIFADWWSNLVEYDDFHQEVAYHEIRFTVTLENAGFKSDTFIPCKKYWAQVNNENIIYLFQKEMLVDDAMPLIKRKVFCDHEWYFTNTLARKSKELMEFVSSSGIYPADLIWEDLLANYSASRLRESLALNFVLPSKCCPDNADTDEHLVNLVNENEDESERICCENNIAAGGKRVDSDDASFSSLGNCSTKQRTSLNVALICYAYYADLCKDMMHYVLNMPSSATIYIVSSNQSTLDAYKLAIEQSGRSFARIEYRMKNNRGRDVSAYLVACRDVFENHDLVCCIHDKKSKQLRLQQTAVDFSYHCLESCLSTDKYVANVIQLFENNPRLGLAVPPTIYYGPFTTLGAELNANEEGVSTLAETLGITSPKDECECAPFGSNFWIRSAAMRTLLAKAWKYEDFPEEPMPVDSTISHAIERIYPAAAQNEGFYTSWIMPDEYERIYLNNVTGVLRKLNASLYKELGVHNATNMRMVVEQHFKNVKGMTEGHKINIKKLMVLELKKMLFFWSSRRRNHYEEKIREYSRV